MSHKNKNAWAEMSPTKKKALTILLPIGIAFTALPIVPFWILMTIDEAKYAPYLIIWAVAVIVAGLICALWVLPWIRKKEALFILEKRYAYLLQDGFAEAEEFETEDEETGIVYTVQKDGLKIVFPTPKEYEPVFDEAPDNIEFLPWERTRLALASSNAFKCVKMALAVLDVSTAQMEEDGETSYEEPFFVPLDERLVRAVKSYGLEEKTDGGWAYLLYNPKDAIRQIYKRGYIRVIRDKITGKVILEDEWEDGRR